jgi:hypothetical protein
MTTYLNQFATIQDAFPKKITGISESERQRLTLLLQTYGHEKMPHYSSYGRVISVVFENGSSKEFEISSFNPLTYTVGKKEFTFKSYEDFLQTVPLQMPKSSFNVFLINSAEASDEETSKLGLAAYFYKSKTVYPEIKRSNVAEKGLIDPDLHAKSVASAHADVSCDAKNETIIPNSKVSYKEENSVTKVTYLPNGAPEHLEFRRNTQTNESVFAICKNVGSSCTDIDQAQMSNMEIAKRLTPADKAQLRKKRDDLRIELNDLFLQRHPIDVMSLKEFKRKNGIKYEKTTDVSVVRAEVLSDKNLEKLLREHQKLAEAARKSDLQNATGVFDKADVLMRSFKQSMATKEDMKKALERELSFMYLGKNPYKDGEDSVFSGLVTQGLSPESLVRETVDRMRPLSDSSGKYNGTLDFELSAADQNKYEKQKSNEVSQKIEADRAAKKSVIEKIKAFASAKRAAVCAKEDAYDVVDARLIDKRLREAVGDDYVRARCLLNESLDDDVISYSELGSDLLNVASCCLDHACKEKALKVKASIRELRKGLR